MRKSIKIKGKKDLNYERVKRSVILVKTDKRI